MSKGGSETQTTELPDWLKQPAIRNLQRAEDVQRIPYMPYRGADVAAFTPATNASFNTNIGAAEAFGLVAPGSLTATSGMPEPTEFAGGWSGYSSMPLYDQALEELKANQPEAWEQYQALYGANVPTQRDAPPSGGGGGGGVTPGVPTTDTSLNMTQEEKDMMAGHMDRINDERGHVLVDGQPTGGAGVAEGQLLAKEIEAAGGYDAWKQAQQQQIDDTWSRKENQLDTSSQIPTGQGSLGSGVYDRALADAASQPVTNVGNPFGYSNTNPPVDYPTQVNPAIPTGLGNLGSSTQGSFTQGGYLPAEELPLDEIYLQELKKKN
jgi:hypothetical protein